MAHGAATLKVILLVVIAIAVVVGAGVVWRLSLPEHNNQAPIIAFKRDQLTNLQTLDAELDAYANGFIAQVRHASLRDSGRAGVGLFIQRTFFRIADGIGFQTPSLSAVLLPTQPPQPVSLDDPRSFVLKPLQGTIIMPPSALSALFNNYLFDYPSATLRHITINTKPNTLIVDGELSELGLWLPFHMRGSMDLAAGHLLVFTPKTVTVEHLSAGALLDLINVELSSFLDIKTKGAEMQADAIVLDLNTSLPPPRLDAHVQSMTLDAQGLHLTFGSQHDPRLPTPIVDANSYIMLQGGDVKTFRSMVVGVRMQLVSRDGSQLDASLYGYRKQLLGGHFEVTPEGGLVAYLAARKAVGGKADND